MKKPTKQNRQRADLTEDCMLHESQKYQDEKTKAAMAYGHRKPYAVTMHDASVGAREDEESNKSDD